LLETMGLYGPMRDVAGAQVQLPGSELYRKVYTTPSTVTGEILFGSANGIALVDFDPASTPATGTRWRQTVLTPSGLSAVVDDVANPNAGRIGIPPVWWFSDQDDVVVGGRTNVTGDPAYAWDRNRNNDFVALAGSPTGAVGGGIISRILVLLGCTSFTDPDPQRFMTIRWSDRFNFEEWTPSDVNISGELQLEGGSRIVGGGVTGFGVVAWTDRRMALLTETFDPDSVFSRRYIDGGRGLLANQSWTEADGQVWWFDEHRTLNVFDGGRPRQIQNPLKYATIERLNDDQLARAYLVPNQEYGEIILHYPDVGSDECDTQLVYNYLDNAWSIWRLERSGWCSRYGVIEALGVDRSNLVWRHDLDTGIPDVYILGPELPSGAQQSSPHLSPKVGIPSADVQPFSFKASTNLITSDEVTSKAWKGTRVQVNHVPLPSAGAEDDEYGLMVTGYGLSQLERSPVFSDTQLMIQGDMARDFRVAGKALQLTIFGTNVKTVFRFANMSITEAYTGAR
jgi:hypothetical protein